MITIQFLGLFALFLVAPLLLLVVRHALAEWWRLLRRMRWLLLSVWLILAYGSAGDALFDLAWMPTYEGVRDASQHVARLVLMLGCLAGLFAKLGRHGLLVALHSLLRPFSGPGMASERLVVRLALVLQNLQDEMPKDAWRKMLDGHYDGGGEGEVLRIESAAWRFADYLLCIATLVSAGVVLAFF